MSILPLTTGLQLGVSMLSIDISVEDFIYATQDGIDYKTSTGTRTVEAVVDASDRRKIEHIFGNSVGDGSILIYTTDEGVGDLYFLDETDLTRRQSFVSYAGYIYRITAQSDWTAQGGIQCYLGERYVAQS